MKIWRGAGFEPGCQLRHTGNFIIKLLPDEKRFLPGDTEVQGLLICSEEIADKRIAD